MLMLRGFTRWIGRLLRLALLAGMLTGVPYGLVTELGWPLPRQLPTNIDQVSQWLTTPVTGQMVINALAVALWIIWGTFTASAAAEIIGAVRGVTVPRLGALAPMQNLAAWLLSGLTAGVLATAGFSPAASMPPADPAPAVQAEGGNTPPATAAADGYASTTSSVTIAVPASPPNAARSQQLASDNTTEQLTHEVASGDWMWHIAGRYLGDETRYPDIAALNPDLAQRHPDFPDHIQPGDRLVLPDDARDRGERRHATGDTIAVSASSGPDPTPQSPEPPAPPPPSASPEPPPPEAEQPDPTVEPSPPQGRDQEPAQEPQPPSPTPSTPETPPAGGSTGEESGDEPAAPFEPSGDPEGVSLPSGAWISAGLAALIATVALILRLHQRRRRRLQTRPIPTQTATATDPVPASLADADAAGTRMLEFDTEPTTLPGVLPTPPATRAPIAVTEHGEQVGLFDLPGPIVALDGEGAAGAVRAVLASALVTGVSQHMGVQPRIVIPADLLAGLLPDGTAPDGLDPHGEAFDGERLIITPDAAAAVARFEEEMVHRWRILDEADAESVTALCQADQQPEHLPPHLLIVAAGGRHLPRVRAIAAGRDALDLHPVVLGPLDDATSYQVEPDGAVAADEHAASGTVVARLSTLTAAELADVLQMVRQTTPRSEAGAEADDPLPEPAPESAPAVIPAPSSGAPPVRLHVLGETRLETDAGPVAGVRTGSLAVLVLLAAHPEGRGMEEIVLALHPATQDRAAARNLVRTDISALRAALREATGLDKQARFITYHDRTRRYAIDADLIEVDLWRMLTAVQTANHASDDQEALTALRQAASCYTGEFAADLEQAWTIGYATTTRSQVVSAYARIAEITEADQPDEAVNALERAIDIDSVNEELYQRLMRIHGRQDNTDAVRATMRLLTNRLAEIGYSEPSQATQRVASRQLAGHRNGRPPRDEPTTTRYVAASGTAPPSSTGAT